MFTKETNMTSQLEIAINNIRFNVIISENNAETKTLSQVADYNDQNLLAKANVELLFFFPIFYGNNVFSWWGNIKNEQNSIRLLST